MGPETGKTSSVTWLDVPASVWALGVVSLLMDVSSELIHSLLPVFLVSVIGASTMALGLIEGAAEAAVAITKVFSGALSDRIGKRKLLVGIGYGLAASYPWSGLRHPPGTGYCGAASGNRPDDILCQ
jgi:MFS family permease